MFDLTPFALSRARLFCPPSLLLLFPRRRRLPRRFKKRVKALTSE